MDEIKRATLEMSATFGNKLWRLHNLYSIVDKDGHKIRFKPNNIQGQIITILQGFKNRGDRTRATFLKYRQGGVSTVCLLWMLDDAIFTENITNAVLSHKRESLGLLGGIMRTAYKSMPGQLCPPLVSDNTAELEFGFGKKISDGKYENQSRIFASLAIRSTVVHNLHISEHCFCADNLVKASISAVPPTGGITCESTGNGVGNHGYLTYIEGKKGDGDFANNAYFFPWFIQSEYVVPTRGIAVVRTDEEKRFAVKAKKLYGTIISDEQVLWRRSMRSNLKDMMGQEFPEDDEEAFMRSGKFFFNTHKAMALLNEAKEIAKADPPVDQKDDWVMYQAPIPGHQYVAGADVAEGMGGDYSTISIIDATRGRQVFRYRARVSVGQFYRECDKWGRLYNNALLAVEANNHGLAVIMGLLENTHYPNLYTDEKRQETRMLGAVKNLARDEREYGWRTTKASRALMLDQLKLAIEGEMEEDVEHFRPEWLVVDEEFLGEALTFVDNEGKFEASAGHFDDLIMANAIANQLFLRRGRVRPNGEKVKVRAVSREQRF
jgi:hypothetical protein